MALVAVLPRGINLGARNKVRMPELREALVAAGFTGVATYAGSGNVVVEAGDRDPDDVAAEVRAVMAACTGVDVLCLARTRDEVDAAVAADPFADRPEVQAFQTYLSSDTWANTKAKLSSGWVSANKGLDQANLTSPIDKLAATILSDPKTVFRFDGSDQMPAAVGSDAFWKQATSWITGQDTKTTVDNIEKAWPK